MMGSVAFAEVKPPVAKRPASDNVTWTPWLTDDGGPKDYHRHWQAMVKLRCYPAYVEGRISKGQEQYRAIYRPWPPNSYWMSYHGMDNQFFAKQQRVMTGLGYRRLCYQAFTTTSGIPRIQATWMKTSKELARDPRYLGSDEKIKKHDPKKWVMAQR